MTRSSLTLIAGVCAATVLCTVPAAHAQGWLGESTPWQFQSSADRANRALVNDLVEKKKAGYYDSFHPTYITNIDRQVNCNFQPTSSGNSNSSAQDSRVGSPDVTASAGNSADSTASRNDTSSQAGRDAASTTTNTQSNTGTITSGVDGSPSHTAVAPINGEHSQGQLAMDVAQDNHGTQTTSVSGSSACDFGADGALN